MGGPRTSLELGPRVIVPADDWVQVNDVLARYSHLLDAGLYAGLGDLFTADAFVDTDPHPQDAPPDYPFPAEGREAVIATLQSLRARWRDVRSRHYVTNVVIVDYDGRKLRSLAAFLRVHTAPGETPTVHSAGHYDDLMVREADGFWRIARRVVNGDRVGAYHSTGDPSPKS